MKHRAERESREVSVQCDDDATVGLGPIQDVVIAGCSEADLTDVQDIVPVPDEELASAAWETLVEEQLHDAAGTSAGCPGTNVAA